VLTALHDCTRCPALVASRRRIVAAYGESPCLVLFVGEAPGYHGADTTGIPFSRDRSGRRLQELLIRCGLSEGYNPATHKPSLRGCAITNVVRCHPAPPDQPTKNRPPSRQEIANCAEHLDADFSRYTPELLVPVGGLALAACLKRFLPEESRPITQLHAVLLELAGPGPRWMLPMRHPSRGSNAEFEVWVGEYGSWKGSLPQPPSHGSSRKTGETGPAR